MRRILAVLLVAGLLVGLTAPAADAGGGRWAGAAVVGLAAFALFAPLIIAGEVLAHTVPYRPVVVAPPPVHYAPAPTYYAPAPTYYAPPTYSTPPPVARPAYAAAAPAPANVVRYSHGRYVLHGDGVTTAYQWVWIPNPPPPPPPPGRPTSYQ
jgi:hypothetical protein